MTEKLYYKDAYIKDFCATVLSCEYREPYYYAVLDKTAFFPEEGGQSADTGRLSDAEVLDVKEKDGTVYHIIDKPLEVLATVKGVLDFDKRYDKMKQHTAEHIISGIINRLYGYSNVGFHLGTGEVTCDFDGPLTREELDRVEDLANSAIAANIPVVASFPGKDDLEKIEYRSKLDLKENVRIVSIDGVDTCACCAPHVNSTGELLLVKILDFVKWRSGIRMTIAAGERALIDYREKSASVKAISVLLSAPKSEVYAAVSDLKGAYEREKALAKEHLFKIAKLEARGVKETDGNLVYFLENMPIDALISFSNHARCKVRGMLVALSGEEGNYKYVISSDTVDLKSMIKDINGALAGRGGGNSGMVQGSFAATLESIKDYFN